MKKTIIMLLSLGILIYMLSCVKSTPGYISCGSVPAVQDSTALLSFAKSNGITPVADTSWLYYQIITQGSGPSPIGSSKISVTYVGKYLDGSIFDSTTSQRTFQLDSLIKGWQYGLPKIQAGGHIKLLVPSSLAFGCLGTGNIPPNTPVYFDINLINIK